MGWCKANSGEKLPALGLKKPNELGLYDMSGTVREWCNDWYGKDYYQHSPICNPQGPPSGLRRVCRGGHYCGAKRRSHSIARHCNMPDTRSIAQGLRLVAHVVDLATLQSIADNLVWVEGGTFNMGSNDGYANERPIHKVQLASYYISKYPVTQAQWQVMMGNNPRQFKDNEACPAWGISWENCQLFIKKLNRLTGKNYRLPTEAEWEYAARGGNQSRDYLFSGSNNLDDVAWYDDNSKGKLHPVGEKNPNELGLYDMSGSIWEWCSNWYGSDDYRNSSATNPQGPSSGSYRVCRGGSWCSDRQQCRSFYRNADVPNYNDDDFGFRLVLQDS